MGQLLCTWLTVALLGGVLGRPADGRAPAVDGNAAPASVALDLDCAGGEAPEAVFHEHHRSIELAGMVASTTTQASRGATQCVLTLNVTARPGTRVRVHGGFTYEGSVDISESGRGRFSHHERLGDTQSDVTVHAFAARTHSAFTQTGGAQPPGGSGTKCHEGLVGRVSLTLRARRATDDAQQSSTTLRRIVLPEFSHEPCPDT